MPHTEDSARNSGQRSFNESKRMYEQSFERLKVDHIYGASQEDRPRFVSFVATTNNPHPLTDATGSRRYICLTIPKSKFIDNVGRAMKELGVETCSFSNVAHYRVVPLKAH